MQRGFRRAVENVGDGERKRWPWLTEVGPSFFVRVGRCQSRAGREGAFNWNLAGGGGGCDCPMLAGASGENDNNLKLKGIFWAWGGATSGSMTQVF